MTDLKTSESVTIDAAISAFTNWRATKKGSKSTPIPNALWDMAFALEAVGYTPSLIKTALGLSTNQYQTQKNKRNKSNTALPETALPRPCFVEAAHQVSGGEKEWPKRTQEDLPSLSDLANTNRQSIKSVKTNNANHSLNPQTVIVECIRDDGHRLRIHTTDERMVEIFSAFFNQPSQVSELC